MHRHHRHHNPPTCGCPTPQPRPPYTAPQLPTLNCARCAKPFVLATGSGRRRYCFTCSPPSRPSRPLRVVVCGICRRTFTTHHSKAKYCGDNCRIRANWRKKTKPAPHHRGDYLVRSRDVRDAANADPATRCWRCGKTLREHAPHHNGKPARWTAGHLRDSDPTSPLLPEASTCNYSAGALLGGRRTQAKHRVEPSSETW
jgi:hypothetical protein